MLFITVNVWIWLRLRRLRLDYKGNYCSFLIRGRINICMRICETINYGCSRGETGMTVTAPNKSLPAVIPLGPSGPPFNLI